MNGTKIEWCDVTWNPVSGCRHKCEYCYARRIAERFGKMKWPTGELHDLNQPRERTTKSGREAIAAYPFGFEPTIHRYRLDEPQRIKKPKNIFVCSMADLFGEWVPDEWIAEVFKACDAAPQHRYLFLTKNPGRYMKLAEAGVLPANKNFWYGSSVPTAETEFWWSDWHNTFVSIEPMLEEFPSAGDSPVKKVGWVIMGAMTGPGSKDNQPKREWVESLTRDALAAGVPVFMKDSLIHVVDESLWRRDYPWD